MSQPHRLALDPGHVFAGLAIDRDRPLRFRLNGRTVSGYHGDSVLSAVLASGVTGYGSLPGGALALDPAFTPLVRRRGRSVDHPVPMRGLVAQDGLDLETVPAPALLGGLLQQARDAVGMPSASLGLGRPVPEDARDAMGTARTLVADIAIVGGGVAGLTAALAAADAGRSVLLCEREVWLGGMAVLFGRVEDEASPEVVLADLRARVLSEPAITVLLGADVFDVMPGRMRIARSHAEGGLEVLAGSAPSILIACGAYERLPIFSGNRLPGVVRCATAFALAHGFGVWPGRSAVVATASNPGYRLAMLAADSGIGVTRVLDPRAQPQSRFIEFCKAYGITMSGGVIPTAVRRRKGGLVISTAVSLEDYFRPEADLAADRLVVGGGWHPDLRLWHAAGGDSVWNHEVGGLRPRSGPGSIALIGAAAGWQSTSACMASAEAGVATLVGGRPGEVVERLVDPQFETPDGDLPVAPVTDPSAPAAFLSAGLSLSQLRFGRRFFGKVRAPARWLLHEQSRRLDLADLVAAVDLGAIPAATAGAMAVERTASRMVLDMHPRRKQPDEAPRSLVPAFLAGRFGPSPALWTIVPVEERRLEPGSLIYINSDQTNPRYAIGVVVSGDAGAGNRPVALIGKISAVPGEGATLREFGRPVAIRLVERHDPGAPLASDHYASADRG